MPGEGRKISETAVAAGRRVPPLRSQRQLQRRMTPAMMRWRRDPVAFVREVLVDPESGQPFVLYAAQERLLRHALTIGASGRLPFAELVYACPKKSGKTATAAMGVL